MKTLLYKITLTDNTEYMTKDLNKIVEHINKVYTNNPLHTVITKRHIVGFIHYETNSQYIKKIDRLEYKDYFIDKMLEKCGTNFKTFGIRTQNRLYKKEYESCVGSAGTKQLETVN